MTESEELIMRPKNNGEFQENERTKEISTLLNTLRHCAKNEVEKVKNLIGNEIIKSELTARKIRRRLTGERYSIFDALVRSDSETSHSLFLRHLLDPMETHDQGTVFIDCFINTLKSLAKEQNIKFGEDLPNDWRSAKSLTEVSHDDGRIDIVIELAKEVCIVIENKVWASEQNRQIARYGKWLKSKNFNHKVLVFLTSTGYSSQTKEGFDVINISYGQLAQLLKLALSLVESTAIPVISVVKQYINVCNYIFTGNKIMSHSNKEIIELLKNPANFEIAWDIKTYIDEIDLENKRNFLNNVAILLNKKIKSVDLHNKWFASSPKYWSSDIAIESNSSAYKVFFGNIFDKDAYQRQLGWFSYKKPINLDEKDIKDLTDKINMPLPNNERVCWLYRIVGGNEHMEIPVMHMSWEDTTTKLAILKDNQRDHSQDTSTLATGLANAMWDIFSKYRVDIEQLASFKN